MIEITKRDFFEKKTRTMRGDVMMRAVAEHDGRVAGETPGRKKKEERGREGEEGAAGEREERGRARPQEPDVSHTVFDTAGVEKQTAGTA